jgi:hypothetical protein
MDIKSSPQILPTLDTNLLTVSDHHGVSTSDSESIVQQLFTAENLTPPMLRSDIPVNPLSTKGSLKSQKREDSPIGSHQVVESRGATGQYLSFPNQPNLRLTSENAMPMLTHYRQH